MKFFFLISVLITTKFCAQNLVNNPSFETISSCGPQATLAVNWQNPTQAGTPDLFNTCAPNWVPAHGSGISSFYQWPRTGNSFIGIWCTDPAFTVREYIHSQLTNTLSLNNYYLVKFYAVLSNFSKYASNNLGLYFSNSTIYQSGSSNFLLNYTPQIKKFNNSIIADTLNWVEVSGIYQANGTEDYITIGNFNDDATTGTSVFNPNNVYGAYYLIDDVSIENITTPQWQYRDTSVVLGDSVLIGPAITGLTIDWYTMSSSFIKNAPGIYVKPTVNTSYKATETFNSAVYNHTVNVTVLPTVLKNYEQLQNSVKLFPNPGNGQFTLQFTNSKPQTVAISICDVTGKEVFAKQLTVANAQTQFDLNVQSGVYLLKINNKEQSLVKKLIVQ